MNNSILGLIAGVSLLLILQSCDIKNDISQGFSWNKDSTRFHILEEKTIGIDLIELGLLQVDLQIVRQRGALDNPIAGYERVKYQLFGDVENLRVGSGNMYIWHFDSEEVQKTTNLLNLHQIPVSLTGINRNNESIIWEKIEPLSNSLYLEPSNWFTFIINPDDSISGFFEGNWQIRTHRDSAVEQFGALSGFISRKHEFHFLTDTTTDFYQIQGRNTSGELRLQTISQIDSLNTTYTFDSLASEGQLSYQYFMKNETDTDSSYLTLNLRKQ